jgi:hypothetical protein
MRRCSSGGGRRKIAKSDVQRGSSPLTPSELSRHGRLKEMENRFWSAVKQTLAPSEELAPSKDPTMRRL